MKKLFPEDKKVIKKGFIEFLDKKGFYIVLILCIAIVGATIGFVRTYNASSPKDKAGSGNIASSSSLTQIGDEKQDTSASSINTTATPAKKPESTKTPAATPKKSSSNNKSSTPASAEVKQQSFINPVKTTLKITKNYSEYPVHSITMDDWRSHLGCDLSAPESTSVVAVADGVVESSYYDESNLGYVVVIKHSNGLKTVYANLASDDVVVANQKVKQGDHIGSVGKSALVEESESPHLHFEVLLNGKEVDPAKYLPIK